MKKTLLFFVFTSVFYLGNAQVYVDQNVVSALNNGSSWENAYTSIQEAIQFAQANPAVTQIWVAEGNYKLTSQNATFNIPEGVSLLGGFKGIETNADGRDWGRYITILNGDVNNSISTNAGDAYTVVTLNDNTILDGFHIARGYSNGTDQDQRGGAVVNDGDNVSINHCVIRDNIAQGDGSNGIGGAILNRGSLTILNSLFYSNSSTDRGGAILSLGNLTLANNTFHNNTASQGAAVFVSEETASIKNCIFKDNTAQSLNNNSDITASYNLFGDAALPSAVTDGGNNIFNSDPQFLDEANHNYFIFSNSLAANVGNNLNIDEGTLDFFGTSRIRDNTVDMGAIESNNFYFQDYEFQTITPNETTGDGCYGDYDSDGDIDMYITGARDGLIQRDLWNNTGNGNYTKDNVTNLPVTLLGDTKFCDLNNDGHLDLITTGKSNNTDPSGNRLHITKIILWDPSLQLFNIGSEISLEGVAFGSIATGDIDNDGDEDVIVSGILQNGVLSTKVYRNSINELSSFEVIDNPNIVVVARSSTSLGDIDGDGDLDLIVTGKNDTEVISKVYKNNGSGVFDTPQDLTGVYWSSSALGDVDNDGDLDLLISGLNSSEVPTTKLYLNDGAGNYADSGQDIQGIAYGDVTFGDVENDGDFDVFIMGLTENILSEGPAISSIYANDGTGSFTLAAKLIPQYIGDVAFGDMDNDGDLDATSIANHNYSFPLIPNPDLVQDAPFFRGSDHILYRNLTSIINTTPNVPTNLSASFNNDFSVTLSWDAATDNETPTEGLTHNVIITEVETGKILKTPMSISNSGQRKLPALGNVMQNTQYTWRIPNNNCGNGKTYQFKVQAIDQAYAGSPFSEVLNVTIPEAKIIYVNAAAPNGGNGNSWAAAYSDLQDALNAASICGDEILVAAGTYKPGENPTDQFNIPPNTKIYGGFNGTETQLNQRDWHANRTILSGNLNNNAIADAGDAQTILNINGENSVVDGFIIEHNYANGITQPTRGGALVNNGTNTNINHCIFRNNKAVGAANDGIGGAVLNSGTMRMESNLFHNNSSTDRGGAIFNLDGELSLVNCTVSNNNASLVGGVLRFGGTIDIYNSILSHNGNNTNLSSSFVTLYNCQLDTNNDVQDGGSNIENTDPLFVDATNNDYTLQESSGAIDQGSNTYVLGDKDLAGNTRKLPGNLSSTEKVDIGAYEFNNTGFIILEDTNLNNAFLSTSIFGDVNNNANQDILQSGIFVLPPAVHNISMYSNDGIGSYTQITPNNDLVALRFSASAFGDIDNDDDLDLIVTGTSGNSNQYYSQIYKNNGSGNYTLSQSSTAVNKGDVAFGDIDNDGDLDLLLIGEAQSGTKISRIYTNNGSGSFSQTQNLSGVVDGSGSFGDVDNDGDLDIFINGDTGSGYISKLYINDSTGQYTATQDLIGTTKGDSGFGDIDNDGDLDLLFTGNTESSGRIAKAYLNNGNGIFSFSQDLIGVSNSAMALGDTDGDGNPNVVISGNTGSGKRAIIYSNNGSGTFSEQYELLGVDMGDVSLADVDNDNRLDILISGQRNTSEAFTRLYKNVSAIENTPPNMPSNLNANINGNTVTLTWDAASDNETPSAGLSYNVFIKEISGTKPHLTAPMAQENDGWRKLPALGNAMQNTFYIWTIPDGLISGCSSNFEFKVQAIDPNFTASEFSETSSFLIDNLVSQTLYVNISNTATIQDGSSWTNAFDNIQDAIAIAGCGAEIWVAVGNYKPTSDGDQTISFVVPQGVALLGGFNGTEINADDRNWAANPTILSGDLNTNDTADAGDSHTIVTVLEDNVNIDGFVIEYSFADDAVETIQRTGGGIYASNANNLTIDHCIFHNNNAGSNTVSNGVGGAIINFGDASTTTTITNSLFFNNAATANGGAISAESGHMVVTNCTIANNDATAGGGIHQNNGDVASTNSIFTNNTGTNGNINVGGSGTSTASHSLFFNSTSGNTGDVPANVTDGGNNLTSTDPIYNSINNINGYKLENTSSAAVEAGNNAAYTNAGGDLANDGDLAGNPRVYDGTPTTDAIDLGAYEFQDEPIVTTDYVWENGTWTPNDPSGLATANDNIIVVNGSTSLTTDTDIKNLTVNSGATLIIPNSLNLSGNIVNNGMFDSRDGSLVFLQNASHSISGSSVLQVGDLTIANETPAQTLTLTNDVPGIGALNDLRLVALSGVLNITNGTLATNDQLVFKSSPAGTGIVGDTSLGTLTGTVVVERHTSNSRAYRLLTAPIVSGTLKDNWMEGVNNPDTGTNLNPNPGFGTHITGANGATNGWDETETNNTSIYTVDNQGLPADYTLIGNPNTENFGYGKGYLVLVRGDRSIDLGSNDSEGATTLRAKGGLISGDLILDDTTLNTGDFETAGNGSSLIGNPYQAPVDMEAVLNSAQDINPNFHHVYDPTIGDRGAFVTVNFGGSPASDVNSFSFMAPDGTMISDSSADRYLQPGQATFINTVDPGTDGTANPQLTFAEADKYLTETNEGVFLTGQPAPESMNSALSIALFQNAELANDETPRDALIVRFSENYSSEIDMQDANKSFNLDENIATSLNDKLLSIDSRFTPTEADEVQLSISNYRTDDYTLRLSLNTLVNVEVFLVDSYLDTSTPIAENGQTLVSFNVDEAIAESMAEDRFKVVFEEELLGVDALDDFSFGVFPNPNDGAFSIQFNKNTFGSVQVSLYNLLGQLVHKKDYEPSGSDRIDIQDAKLQTGVYLLEVETERSTATKQIIIK